MLAFAYILSITITILLPLFLATWLRRRFRVSWFLFAVGTLTFIGSQVVHLPLNALLSKWSLLPIAAVPTGAALWRVAIIAGLTAGVCEELARTAGYALLKRFRKVEDGIMLGLGHGGVEAMIILGIVTAGTIGQLFALRGTDLSTLSLSAAQMAALGKQMQIFNQSPLVAFLPLLERMIAMTFHVILSLLVLRAFQHRNAMWVILAILYHAIVDFGAVMLSSGNSNPGLIEVILLLSLIPGLIWVFYTYRSQFSVSIKSRLPVEWGLFGQSLRKELMQLWRTKMVFVILSVFAIFGIASPLLAYFLPQILGSVAGAEMFKDLIPVPALKDSLDQYIKNISQFGFLIAILVGMGKVASEKESGMTEMILNKPLPRWAFILSKFVAQALVYMAAFLVAEVFAYGYSVYLFQSFSFAVFSWMNLLLYLWLMVFVAITTLGSTVARSTGAAAGISLASAIVILLSGSIPRYGGISPQALMTWVASMTSKVVINLKTSNFTALGAAVVVIIIALVWAVGLFEQQEI